MRILITGGTGYIGQALCPRLLAAGHELHVLSRQPASVTERCGNGARGFSSFEEIRGESFDAVINLAGESIAGGLWTRGRKQKLRDSRIALTESLCRTLAESPSPPHVFISGSAVGYYGDQGDAELDESSVPIPDFAQTLCADWERAADAATDWGARVVKLRIGLVMGPDGGFLAPLRIPFKLGLGTRLGSGRQYMSWISREDMVRVVEFALAQDIAGAINACAPNPVDNAEFTRALAGALNRPVFPISAPAFALRLALGEMSQLLLGGQRVVPARLTAAGFDFTYPELAPALREAVG